MITLYTWTTPNGRKPAIMLEEMQRARCVALVAHVFKYFEEWTNELLTYAVDEIARPSQPSRQLVGHR